MTCVSYQTEAGTDIIHVMSQHYTVDYEPNIKDPVGMYYKIGS
jgi:cell division ATPase FtsA